MKKFFSLVADNSSDTFTDRTHYRSKLYTSKTGVNPLVTAAYPLFSILERINLSEKPPELNTLQDNLLHELYAFITKISAAEYTDEIIQAARYLLCATMDEVIEKAYHKETETTISCIIEDNTITLSPPQPLLETETHSTISASTHVFQLLDKAIIKPNFYLDVIELMYFCIITGFEGKYRQDPNGKQALENLLDKLYQIIQEHKPPVVEKLFIPATPTRRFTTIKPFPWKTFIGALMGTVLIGYFLFNYQINHQANELLKHVQQRTY